jgi:hypothetical protein
MSNRPLRAGGLNVKYVTGHWKVHIKPIDGSVLGQVRIVVKSIHSNQQRAKVDSTEPVAKAAAELVCKALDLVYDSPGALVTEEPSGGVDGEE